MDGGRNRILVVDRSRLVAEAVAAVFQELIEQADVKLAHSLDDAVAIALRDQPALVILDAWIAGMDSVASTRKVLAASPQSSVIVIATKVDGALAAALEQAGAAGCYEKERLPLSAHRIVAGLVARP